MTPAEAATVQILKDFAATGRVRHGATSPRPAVEFDPRGKRLNGVSGMDAGARSTGPARPTPESDALLNAVAAAKLRVAARRGIPEEDVRTWTTHPAEEGPVVVVVITDPIDAVALREMSNHCRIDLIVALNQHRS